MTPELTHSREFSVAKLYMWRTVVAIAHVDGNVCEDERAYLESVFERMRDSAGLSDDQYGLLMADLNIQQDALDMLQHVDDPRYRGQILHFAQMLAAKDGVICDAEAHLIERLHVEINRDMDAPLINTEERLELLGALDDDKTKSHGRFVALVEKFILSTGLKG